MTNAVIYARVSSREQEREGYSIPAQLKLLHSYADALGLTVAAEFIDVESAKNPGRKEFGKMLHFLVNGSGCRIVLVEKTDRLYRNRTDSVKFEELIEGRNVEAHLVKEGRIIGKNSRSQDKFMHDIHVAVARNYSENLREEVKKGMKEKAEQGWYPTKAPFGYRNNRSTRTIEPDPIKAPIVRRIFELYASGNYSLTDLRRAIRTETGVTINRAYLHQILKSRFYLGYFEWCGIEYKGNHVSVIDASTFESVRRVFSGFGKSKYRKHEFAFGGLLTCAHDGCRITAGLQKKKYVYYRCTQGRGTCDTPYVREERLSDQLGEVLKGIYVPETVAMSIVASLAKNQEAIEANRTRQLNTTRQGLEALRTRMDKVYEDRLNGSFDEQFLSRKMEECRSREIELLAAHERLKQPISNESVLTVARIFELAQKAHSLYLTRNHVERGQLLKKVLLNCSTDGVSLTPTYRKPFDSIFERAKNQEWSGRADLNCRPLAPQASALPG
jgi:site-specific DNA recombinase